MPLEVAGRVIGCWFAASVLCLLVALAFGLDSALVIFAAVMFSVPFLAIAITASVCFNRAIVAYPELWALAALAISNGISFALLGRGGLVGLYVAIPAAIAFPVWMRLRPLHR